MPFYEEYEDPAGEPDYFSNETNGSFETPIDPYSN